jgi:hypothetical protein
MLLRGSEPKRRADNLGHVSPLKEPPPPLEGNDTLVTASLTVAWTVALVVLLIVGPPGRDRWWIWTCVTGVGLGVFGLCYVPFLKRGRARAAAQRDNGSNTVSSTDTPGRSTKS